MVGAGEETAQVRGRRVVVRGVTFQEERSWRLTVVLVGDGDGGQVPRSHHGRAPVLAERRPQVELEVLVRLKHRVIADTHRTVLYLGKCSCSDYTISNI